MNFKLKSQKIQLSENDVEEQCKTLAGLHGYRLERLHAGTAKTLDGRFWTLHPPGTPDWLAAHGRRPSFYLEVKRPGEKTSPVQDRKHHELRLQGQIVVTVDSVEAFKDWLALQMRGP